MREFLASLLSHPRLAEQVVHRHEAPASPARYRELEAPLSPALRAAAWRLGVDRLYSHQAEAIDRIRAGEDVAVVTPTASGKSLVNYLPTAELLEDGGGHALYVFPHKALEQDQLKKLEIFGSGLYGTRDLTAAIYDGDTPGSRRRKIRAQPPDVLITNPEMLHLGLLAYHGEWARFFGGLRLVVLDELHVYRGVFGSHFAHVMRRLARVTARYGAEPRYLVCSATIGNPGPFTRTLMGRPFHVVSDSGSPRAGRHFLFVNPTGSPYTTAMRVFVEAVRAGLRTIAFTKARRITELIHSWVAESAPDLARRIAPYRAGYLPEERREIERRLFRGDLTGVIATSALELGIDVGGLDVCILVGYPGSVMSSWQRIGRVGRQSRESLVVLVAQPDALDQYFMTHPAAFFERGFEPAVLDPSNPIVASAHLVCAGAEIPLDRREAEDYLDPRGVSDLLATGRLVEDEAGVRLFALARRPQRDVNLRSGGESYAILADEGNRAIGTIDGVRVFHECHEGAVYLHGGRSHRVVRLDREARRVFAVPFRGDYYTQALGAKETEILETHRQTDRSGYRLSLGRLRVTVRITEYARKRISDQETLSRHPIELPPIVFETIGFWISLPDELEREAVRSELHFMGGLHASEHAMISLFPLLALCDRADIGGISYSRNPQLGVPAIFVYDGHPGGIGLTAAVHDRIEELFRSTLDLLRTCPCEDGCPSCVQSPKCGSGNRPLDKDAALLVLEHLCGEAAVPAAPWPRAVTGLVPEHDVAGRSDRPHRVSPEASPSPPPSILPQSAGGLQAYRLHPDEGRVLVFDLETQRSADEVGGWHRVREMRLALGVVCDVSRNQFTTYFEKDVERLVLDLVMADRVIGFNSDRFDFAVLSAYGDWNLARIRSFDMLKDIRPRAGFRLKLADLAEINLHLSKSADGLQSLAWVKEGRLDLVEEYCRRDVELTARLFFLGRDRGYILFRHRTGENVRLPVDW